MESVSKFNVNGLGVNVVQPPPTPVDPGGGFPPPDGSVPCATVVKSTTVTTTTNIVTDSLTKHFPCATKLILNKLATISGYASFTTPFATVKKPDLTWQSASSAWNSPSPITGAANVYELGHTGYIGRSAIISLNSNMLQNSSQLLIAAASIHETLHAYINYNIVTYTDGFKVPANYSSSKPWLYALDAWTFMSGLPPNYRDHYEMLNDYFSKAVDILKAWDNSAHTDKQYAMAMLFGLDTGDSLPMQGTLDKVYNDMMSKYNITTTDINTFWKSQLTTTVVSDKLPTGGCN